MSPALSSPKSGKKRKGKISAGGDGGKKKKLSKVGNSISRKSSSSRKKGGGSSDSESTSVSSSESDDDEDEDNDVNIRGGDSSEDDEDDDEDDEENNRKQVSSLINDEADLSGSDDEEDEEDDEPDNDYVKDGFVVDSDEEQQPVSGARKKHKRIKKIRKEDRLDEDDLLLLKEARGGDRDDGVGREGGRIVDGVRAQTGTDLRDKLFESDDDDEEHSPKRGPGRGKRPRGGKGRRGNFGDDEMNDFIDWGTEEGAAEDEDDDIYDDVTRGGGGVSEAQLNEASDIFGTDYLNFIDGDGGDNGDGGDDRDVDDDDRDDYDQERRRLTKNRSRERGVGVDLGVDTDNDTTDDEDEDLWDSDEDVRAKRKERVARKAFRKKELDKKRAEKRRAKLRKSFEPVQLIENFCTEQDDKIRMKDTPERSFDWAPIRPGREFGTGNVNLVDGGEEEEEAMWMLGRIPGLAEEFFLATLQDVKKDEGESDEQDSAIPGGDHTKRQRVVVDSIIYALRLMHRDKLEVEFITKYRADIVTSPAVRNNLHAIREEDVLWDRLTGAREKVKSLLKKMSDDVAKNDALSAEEENVCKLRQDAASAQRRLNESLAKEAEIVKSIEDLGVEADDDDDDNDLFGDDDDDSDNDKELNAKKSSLEEHLQTTRNLNEVCSEKIEQVTKSLLEAESKYEVGLQSTSSTARIYKKMNSSMLWEATDLNQYLSNLTDHRQLMDVYNYLTLIREGNDAIRSKESVVSDDENKNSGAAMKKKNRRSRKFARDYYRTCVSEGLRNICYRFVLSPFRAGIKVEDNITLPDGFQWDRPPPGASLGNEETSASDPKFWLAPNPEEPDPRKFASDLVGNGELILLSSTARGAKEISTDHPELTDPLRGCRYVAAIELAYDPRVRRHLRSIYRSLSCLTARPTSKGLDVIDAFHEFYGLHLLYQKPVSHHFPIDSSNSDVDKEHLKLEERRTLDDQTRERERKSCLQYLNLLKADKGGYLKVIIHLPFVDGEKNADWHDRPDTYFDSRNNQDLSPLMDELRKVYLSIDGGGQEWNKEREKVLYQALHTFLLPQLEAETRRDLREASIKIGIKAAGKSFQAMAMEGPYRPSHLLGESRFLVPTGDLPIVGVCCSLDNKDATYLALVNEQGEFLESIPIPGGARIDNSAMSEKVIAFLMQHRPSCILVGTNSGLISRLTSRKLSELAAKATEKWNNRFIQAEEEDDEDFDFRKREFDGYDNDDNSQWSCNVELVDDNVAQLFGRSVRGKKEFPEALTNLRCAISIARHGKHPLAELCYAWMAASDAGVFGTETLYLNVHPLQRLFPKTLLLKEYENVLYAAVADVGVDVNLACEFDHMHGLLSFVPGLGPRKAMNLKESVALNRGSITKRLELLEKRMLGPVVYNNAIAFLRIQDKDDIGNQMDLHPLDNTRLHPDIYIRNNWVNKIATDALESVNIPNNENDNTAILNVMTDSKNEISRLFNATKTEYEEISGQIWQHQGWDPRLNVPNERWGDKIEELDLEKFAEMLEQNDKGKWLSHFIMTKWEIRLPFEDPRKPMEPIDEEKLFHLLTGESDLTLFPGREVTGKVFKIDDFGATIKLEGGITGWIALRNLADEHTETVEDVVHIGNVITAMVIEVKKGHLSCDLSLKMEDFRKPPSHWERLNSLPVIDRYFDENAATCIEKNKSKDREKRLEALQSAFGKTKIGDDSMEIDNGKDGTKAQGRLGKVSRRACAHPAFRNGLNDEIDKELKDGGEAMVGEALIRPSSKTADSLAVHWMVRPGIIKVVEVLEKDKDNDASIGNILEIKNEIYNSIDELLARYISPLNERIEEAKHHRKFEEMLEENVDEKLKNMKKVTPSGIFYFLCWNEQFPGYISLRYIMNSVRYHHIGITPDGFVWRSKTYPNLDALLNSFKKNPRGVISSGQPKPGSSVSSTQILTQSKPEMKQSRWGAKSSAPDAQPPPPPPPANSGWGSKAVTSGWSQPPPPALPPPPNYSHPLAAPPGQPPAPPGYP